MLSPFRILSPTTIDEASSELTRLGEQAAIYAGGAELLLLMRQGLLDPDYLVNVKRIPRLHGLTWDGEQLHIGAALTHREVEISPLVHQHLSTLAEAEHHIGNIRVRSQGTIGGNLCFADPHSDPGTALLVHDASVTLSGKDGDRELPLDEFFVGTYETALQSGELLSAIHAPALPSGWSSAFMRVERFYRPTVNVGAAVKRDDGHIQDLRLSVGCVGPRAMRLREMEDRVRGSAIGEVGSIVSDARSYLMELLEPVDDLLGSADYKMYITSVLLRRAIERAAEPTGDLP